MIWATVSSQPCFCWLYRASPSLAAKNIISLILVLAIWWCSCVESSLVLLKESVCYDQYILLAKLLAFALFILYSKANLPITSSISWLPTFTFQSPMMERISFFVVSSRRSWSNTRQSIAIRMLSMWKICQTRTHRKTMGCLVQKRYD